MLALGSKLPALVSMALNGPAGLLEDMEGEAEEEDECKFYRSEWSAEMMG